MKKISFKRIGIIALAVIIVLIALRFIFYRETLWIGLALLLAGLIAFLVWKAFVKNGREDLRRSERKGKELE
jgi:multisubunit Na+/H+ antiporter MnhG subunit